MSSPDATVPSPAPQEREAREDCGAQLKQLFPALFTQPPKPLKLRIQADIQERQPGLFSKAQLSAFFRRYTGSHAYLNALSRATHRFDLDGNPGDALSDEHRQAALEELKRRRGVQQERRAAEDEARRQRHQLLRDFERTTLTPANFSALKGLTPEALEATLVVARKEAEEGPPPELHRRGPRDGQRGGPGRGEARGPRADGAGRGEQRGGGGGGGGRGEAGGAGRGGPGRGEGRGPRNNDARGPRDGQAQGQGRGPRGPRPDAARPAAAVADAAAVPSQMAAQLAGLAAALPRAAEAPAAVPAPAPVATPAADTGSDPAS